MFQTLSKISDTISRITDDTIIGKAIMFSSVFFSSFFLPIVPIILLCFVATLIDMYYGIKVADSQKVKPQSRYMWTGTLRKLRDTFVILTMARGIELYILNAITDAPLLVGSSALVITLTEVWSIIENMNTLNPHGPWRILNKFLKKKGSRYLNIDIEELEREVENELAKNNKNNKNICGAVLGIPCAHNPCANSMGNEQADIVTEEG